ncbi:prominin-1-A-like [Tiliqua scincoides]|uniref:prominin-1-A-like n=1 Tax=Tiliqua scincoides TaxID=71010 RepID=UPI003461B9AD
MPVRSTSEKTCAIPSVPVHGVVRTGAELVTNLYQQRSDIHDPKVYKELLIYEAGFLVCVIIGLLFIILVPLVGMYFCCCRCCGHCGGRMYQKQSKHTGCKRQTFFVSLLAVTTLLLAGDICAYISNHRTTQAIDDGFHTLNSTMDNLHIFLNSIPEEIDFIISTSSVPLDHANNSLLDIGHTLGDKIEAQLGGRAREALNTAEQLLREAGILKRELQMVDKTSSQLQKLQKELTQNLTNLRKEINKTLHDCGKPCQDVSVNNLVPGTDFSEVPDVNPALQLLENLTHSDPNATIEKARKALEDIPRKVSEQTQKVKSEAQGQLDDIKWQINNIRSNLSELDNLGNASNLLDDLTKRASVYEPDVTYYDGYRWIISVCLCCLVLLIIICNVLGLLFGALGLDTRVLPTKRGCLSNSGGDFLMASVGFSFIFAWLLMVLVLLMFLLGGNAYTLVCRSWANGQLLQFLDTPGLFRELNVTQLLHLKHSDVTLSSIYKNCANNAPLWSTLHLDEIVPLDETLNISKYTQGIDSVLSKLNVSVSTADLLNDEQKQLLKDLGKKDGFLHLNFKSALEQLNRDMIRQDLLAFAVELDNLANKTVGDGSINKQLQDQAAELRKLQAWANSNFPPEIHILNNSILSLQQSVPQIQGLVNSTLTQVEEAQSFMKQKTNDVVKNETVAFVHSVVGSFESYLNWAKSTIKGQVARCGPAAWTLDSVNTIVCSYIVDSLNAFWFSLGWCTIFLLPSIILAVRLAKFYRRMRMDDVYEDTVETMELSRSIDMFKMPRAELRK